MSEIKLSEIRRLLLCIQRDIKLKSCASFQLGVNDNLQLTIYAISPQSDSQLAYQAEFTPAELSNRSEMTAQDMVDFHINRSSELFKTLIKQEVEDSANPKRPTHRG